MKISVIIPTRERSQFLVHAIRTVLAIPDPDLEIVVSDNASLDNTALVLAGINDRRLKVVNPGRRLSMRANFEFALSCATGEYVNFIGDDDGFLPRQFTLARSILERHRPDTLSYPWVQYLWPDKINGPSIGKLRVERRKALGEVQPTNIPFLQARLLGGKPRISGEMPGIYHSFAARSYLEAIRSPEGFVFGGRIPDLYVAFNATLRGGSHLHTTNYFTINGASPASTGWSHGRRDTDDQPAEPAKKFDQEASNDFVEDIAFFGIGIPQAMFTTLETVRAHNYPNRFIPDYAAWYSKVLQAIDTLPNDSRKSAKENLEKYAVVTGTVAELRRGSKGTPWSSRLALFSASSFSDRLARSLANFWSFRVEIPEGYDDTIFGACNLFDSVLRDEPEKFSKRVHTQAQAWAQILQNGKKFYAGR